MRLLGLSLLILLTGCTVYKSSDRDDFNANGKSRAPAHALTGDDRDLLANPCAAFNTISDEQLTTFFGPTPRLSMVNEISPKTSTCLITTLTSDLSAPSVVACSWKPANGDRIAVSDEFAVQTTEGELREQGFDVVTSTVVSGERLRMNCEAYAPTSVLIEDRRTGESGSAELSKKFAAFTRELSVQTLPADAQP